MNLILAFAFLFMQTDVPFKPKDEFEIKLDYQIKKRPTVEAPGYSVMNPVKKGEPMTSYVILNIKILKKDPNEPRIVVNSNLHDKIFNKKYEAGTIVMLDLGFTDDIKSRATAHEYVVNFLNPEKIATHKILIQIDEDGVFNVNGEIRGKF